MNSDDDLLIARGMFLSMCRDNSETLHRSECERLAEWVWNHFHRGATALKPQVCETILVIYMALDFFEWPESHQNNQQELTQIADQMVSSPDGILTLPQFLQWYSGVRQQIEEHRQSQGECRVS